MRKGDGMFYNRVRYKKSSDAPGILVSIQDLLSETTEARYKVKLDTIAARYFIINLRNGGIVIEGNKDGVIKNIEVLQRHINRDLKSLGVNLVKEVRINNE